MATVYTSETVGGNTPSGAGASNPTAPDVRLILTNEPLGPITTNRDIAARSKSVQYREKTYTDANGYEVEYLVSGIGSSTLVDTDGDVFHKSAIESMARESIDLNTLLNHVGTVPWNIAGSVLETEVDYKSVDGVEHCVLKLVTDIEPKHPDAWRTYEMIAGIDCRPRKLGFSVGCLYTEATPRRNEKGVYRGLDVHDVLPVEFSIVSMPANRLAWIETIARDLQEKGVLPKRPNLLSKDAATSQDMLERITDWMDFGAIDGPKLEKLAHYFEDTYGIVYARMPRSA